MLRSRVLEKEKLQKKIIEKKYKDYINNSLIKKIIETFNNEIVEKLPEEQRPLLITPPKLLNENINDIDLENDFKYELKYDVYPNVKIKTCEGFDLEVDEVVVNDQDLEKELKILQINEGVMYEKEEPVENGDYLNIKYTVYDGENEIDKNENFTFTIGENQNFYEFDEELIGLKKGDEKQFEKDYLKDFKIEKLKGKKIRFEIKVNSVRRKKLPDLDDEFAKDINEKYNSLDDLKKDIKKRLNNRCENINLGLKQDVLFEKLSDENNLLIPESMFDYSLEKRWMNLVRQFGGDEKVVLNIFNSQGKNKKEILNDWRDSVKKELESSLFASKLLKKEGFQISEKEINDEIANYIENEHDKENAKEYYNKKEIRENIKDNLKLKRILLDVFSKNNFKVKEKIEISNYLKKD